MIENLLAELLGILVTVFIVNALIKKNENKRIKKDFRNLLNRHIYSLINDIQILEHILLSRQNDLSQRELFFEIQKINLLRNIQNMPYLQKQNIALFNFKNIENLEEIIDMINEIELGVKKASPKITPQDLRKFTENLSKISANIMNIKIK